MDQWIDTHAHVFSNKFGNDLEEVMQRALLAGVGQVFMPNIDSESIEAMLEVEDAYPCRAYAMMGLHPTSVKENYKEELAVIEKWLQDRDFVAIGEMGTDLYWDKTFFTEQKDAFRIQANWAKDIGKPIVIHCRNSMKETLDLVEELQDGRLTGVFHCFVGDNEDAKRIADLGFYLGLGGVATFKNGGIDTVIPSMDHDRIVMETDSPYLAPKPHRGKRNEPAYIPIIGQKVADLLEMPLSDLAELTTNNALRLYQMEETETTNV
ncbi:MAG TPA: hydrolase TatD [Cytophagales bacterium]|nr:hydrolase TatD [Cytophagales bacterium]HAA19923.1 hydrolase TatD [Cytophagales bacterium]HAP62649.1 hydrolase TatD [Cytophagales bacterium]